MKNLVQGATPLRNKILHQILSLNVTVMCAISVTLKYGF